MIKSIAPCKIKGRFPIKIETDISIKIPKLNVIRLLIRVIPKILKFWKGTLALISNLPMSREAYFQIFR